METTKKFKQACEDEKLFACGIIGPGNMAMAIVAGLIKAEKFKGEEILISGTRNESFRKWEHLKVNTTLDNLEVITLHNLRSKFMKVSFQVFQKCRLIFLCIKPDKLRSVAQPIASFFLEQPADNRRFANKTLVSILAGISIESLTKAFHSLDIAIIRAMPNTFVPFNSFEYFIL